MTARSPSPICAALVLLASIALAQTASAQTQPAQTAAPASKVQAAKKNLRINVYFQKVDDKGLIILKYGSVLLTTKLAGIRLRDGSAGVLSLVLPTGVLLQAEVIAKGINPSVVLWNGAKNLNEELLIQGVAEGVH